MPSVSEKQHRAMEAAAHGHSTLGIPKNVGEEFVAADAEFNEADHPRDSDGKFSPTGAGTERINAISTKISAFAAPILAGLGKFKANGIDNRKNVQSALEAAGVAFVSEFSNGTYPMGIHRETGEIIINTNNSAWDKLQSVIDRKHDLGIAASKEKGYLILHELAHKLLGDFGNKALSDREKAIASKVSKYAATNNDEFVAEFIAGSLGGKQYSDDVKELFLGIVEDGKKTYLDSGIPHEGFSREEFTRGDENPPNELDIAKAIQRGELSSPQRYENIWLFDVRVTGTGTSYRTAIEEYVYRPPEDFLSPDFLERCNGLPLIFEHPEKSILNTEEFRNRSIGNIILPYIKSDEVWGIAKVYDDDAAIAMQSTHISTSPAVVFRNAGSTETIELDDGKSVLIEGKPSYLDHLAICEIGVWDKGGEPAGINNGDPIMPDKDKLDEFMDAIKGRFDSLDARMDGFEKARKDSEEKEEKEKEEKKDAETIKKEEDKEKEREEKERKDAEEKEKKEAEEKADAAKTIKGMAEQIAALNARLAPLTNEDRDALSKAQSRASVVAQMFGDSVTAPLHGETPIEYRKRLADKFKKHSAEFKETRLDSIDGSAFDLIETKIYADAQAAALDSSSLPEGRLMPIVEDLNGRKVTRYVGDIKVAMGPFMHRPIRAHFVTKH